MRIPRTFPPLPQLPPLLLPPLPPPLLPSPLLSVQTQQQLEQTRRRINSLLESLEIARQLQPRVTCLSLLSHDGPC